MSDKKPKGKAIVIEADIEPPTPEQTKQMQKLARRVGYAKDVSLSAIQMLEAVSQDAD
ncbi:MAG TPA: hypothetical protein VNI84_13810 [Pyrinomonadaceae bacterium]|nr:hypothetical protein [Pyrinomonadaceae bacterium]